MKRHLVLCGKWLAGTSGVTALAYFVATEAAGGRHPVWPYGLFGGLLAVGLALYFTCQEGEKQDTSAKHETAQAPAEAKHDDAAPAQYDESPTSAAEDQVWAGWNDQYYTQPEIPPEPQSPPPGDPLTDRWRHTADGFKASPLMNITSYAMPGFMGSYDGSPFIRVGICVACDPVESEVIDSSQIRTALANFLSRDPVARLTELMTYIDEGSTSVPQPAVAHCELRPYCGQGNSQWHLLCFICRCKICARLGGLMIWPACGFMSCHATKTAIFPRQLDSRTGTGVWSLPCRSPRPSWICFPRI